MRFLYITIMVLAALASGRAEASGLPECDPASVVVPDSLGRGRMMISGKTFLRQMQERDSVLIADQLFYGFRLEGVEEGTRLAFPDLSKGFTEGVEVISGWIVDTLRTKKTGKGQPRLYDIESGVMITSFEEGTYGLDALAVLRVSRDGVADTLVFEPQMLDVRTIPIDTESFEPHDIKGQICYPLTFSEVLPWLAGIQALAMLAVAIYCLVRIYRRRNDPQYVRKEPAHIVALRKLDRYRGDKMWAPEKQKAFYSGVTDALREYIASRYGIGAMEMTTAEIFKDMGQTDAPEALLAEVRELFERADFVKFAKYVASEQENASALPLAVRFVTETYQAEIEAEGAEQAKDDKDK
ncbi:MAG: hypothetical protein ACI3ZL_03680 [Candidatus Cryptobacteroides sp.]